MNTTTATRATCTQCGTDARITEPHAFGGRDKDRMTLSCGHVVLRRDRSRREGLQDALAGYEAACARGSDLDVATAAMELAAAVRTVLA